jgi:chromosome segregation ATPase
MIAQLKAGENYLRELGALTSGVVQVSTEVRAAASELKTTNTALSDSIKTLIKPAEALAQQQEKLLQTVQQSVGLLQGTSATVRDIVARQQNMSKELVDVLDNLKLAVEGFDKAVRDQASLVGQHATFLQHLQNEHDKQAQLAVLLSDTTAAAKHTLDEMNNGAIYIRSIAVDMHDLLNLQASLSTNPTTAPAVDLLAVINKYAAAAEKMENSGKTLTVSAQTIDSSGRALAASATQMQRASQQLKDVLDNLSGGRNGHN